MQTFEQKYKEILLEQLKEFINKKIIVSNDINVALFGENEECLIAIIRTAPGELSSKAGYDLTTQTFFIDFIVDNNDLQKTLGALNNLITIYNGIMDELDIKIYDPKTENIIEKTYNFKPVFTRPFVPSNPFNVKGKKEIITANTITMSVRVGYGSTADVKPKLFKLKIGNSYYDINAVRYDITTTPNYLPSQKDDEIFLKQRLANVIVSYVFTILKYSSGIDNLSDILEKEPAEDKYNMLFNNELKLKINDNKEIDISSYNLSETYENGTTIFILTLIR